MIITINKIYDGNYIHGSSFHGDLYGKYFGEKMSIGKKCDVEIEVSKVFTINDFKISNNKKFSVFSSNGMTTINGLVQQIDDDILYILFDFDLIALEILSDVDYQSLLNQYVSFTFDDLKLYDTGLIS